VIESPWGWSNGAPARVTIEWTGHKWSPVTVQYGFSFTALQTSVSVPQFDDQGGTYTLTEAAFEGAADYHRRVFVECIQYEPGYIDFGINAPFGHTMKVRLPSSAKIVVNDTALLGQLRVNLGPFDDTIDFANTNMQENSSGEDSGTQFDTSQGTSLIRVQNQVHLSELRGTGSTACNVTRDGNNFTYSHYPNMVAGFDFTCWMSSGSVTYTFQ
jgi:hypothetical protein